MSLLRQALPRPATASRSLVAARLLSTESKTPATTEQTTTSVVPDAPARNVIAAEIASGAPGPPFLYIPDIVCEPKIVYSRASPSCRQDLPTHAQHYTERIWKVSPMED